MYNTIWLVNSSISFYFITSQREFSNCKNSCFREELSDVVFFFRINCNISLYKNIVLVGSHSRPLSLVCVPPHMTLFPSPTTFRLFPFLSASPSTAALFERYTISNAFNARSTSWIILAEESVTIFDSRIRFSPLVISFGVEKLKRIFLSSSSDSSPYSKKWLKTQWKRKLYKIYILRILSKGIHSGLLPTGWPS